MCKIRYLWIVAVCVSVAGCQITSEKKQQKIEEKLQLTNQKNIKKHNDELILPPFLKNYSTKENNFE